MFAHKALLVSGCCLGLLVGSAVAGVTLSVNFGSTELQTGTTPMPRSAEATAGVVDAPWWNNFMVLADGTWRPTAQAGLWVFSDGAQMPADSGFAVRAVTDPGVGTGASYLASRSVAMKNNHEMLFADSLRNTAARRMLGIEIAGMPAAFTRHGLDVYIVFQDTAFSTTGIYRIELDVGLTGQIDHVLYTRQGHPDTVLNPHREFYHPDPGFVNHQSADINQVAADDWPMGNYVVFRNVAAEADKIGFYVTNTTTGGRSSIAAFQVQAVPEPGAATLLLLGSATALRRPVRQP